MDWILLFIPPVGLPSWILQILVPWRYSLSGEWYPLDLGWITLLVYFSPI